MEKGLDPYWMINTLFGLFNFGRMANDLIQKVLREYRQQELILECKDCRDMGFNDRAIIYLDKAIELQKTNDKLCSQLYAIKGLIFLEEASNRLGKTIMRTIESEGGTEFLSKPSSGEIIICTILEDKPSQEKFQYALEAHENALKLDPDFLSASANKSFILALIGRWEDAVKSIDNTLKIAPLDEEFMERLLTLKGCLSYFYDLEESMKCFFDVIGIDHQDSKYYKIALICLKYFFYEIKEGNIILENNQISFAKKS